MHASVTTTNEGQDAAETILSSMEAGIADTIEHARERLADLDASGGLTPAPAVVDAIEAEFMLAVYTARRLARRRLLGLEPAPVATPEAIELLRRSRAANAHRRRYGVGVIDMARRFVP